MKIDEIYKNLTLIDTSKEAVGGKRADGREGSSLEAERETGPGTEVAFSQTSVDFSRAAKIMEKDAVERARRVDEIRAQLEEGSYQVDAAKVADKIIQDALADLVEP